MIRAAITLAALVLLSGCYKQAESSATAGLDFRVERLFTHDGCTVYRFQYFGTKYFTRCDGSVSAEVSWQESCGKSCSRQVSVPTARGKGQP